MAVAVLFEGAGWGETRTSSGEMWNLPWGHQTRIGRSQGSPLIWFHVPSLFNFRLHSSTFPLHHFPSRISHRHQADAEQGIGRRFRDGGCGDGNGGQGILAIELSRQSTLSLVRHFTVIQFVIQIHLAVYRTANRRAGVDGEACQTVPGKTAGVRDPGSQGNTDAGVVVGKEGSALESGKERKGGVSP